MIRRKLLASLLLLLIILATAAFVAVRPDRPPRSDLRRELFQGVTYTRQALDQPRPLMLHIVEIDLAAPGVSFLVTPGDPTSQRDVLARTTGDFLVEFGVQLAVNGGYFDPLEGRRIRQDTPLNIRGLAMSEGLVYSDDFPYFPVLCLGEGWAVIQRAGCPAGATNALSGSPLLVESGQLAGREIARYRIVNHPRTAVAIDPAGGRLWLILVDGRQRNYSEGVTLYELADIAIGLGAHTALNLDGGGSTTLVMAGPDGSETLNSPVHTRIPMRQRPVGNHLGVFASPIAGN